MKQSFKKRSFLLFVLALISHLTIAQVKIGTNPTTINPASILEIESANKGFLMPRIALTGANVASPLSAHVAGMIIYNTATTGTAPNGVVPGVYYNDGTRWVAAKGISGNGITNTTNNGDGTFTFNFSDGTSFTSPKIVSADAGNLIVNGADGGAKLTSANLLSATTNILSSSGTIITSNVNGVTSSADLTSIVAASSTNLLTLSGVTLTSTVNGIAKSVDLSSVLAVSDATTTAKGVVRLAGDLGGTGSTAAAPLISNNAITHSKLALSSVKNNNIAEAIAVAKGGSGNDMSATQGYVKQATAGANFTTLAKIPVAEVDGAVRKVNGVVPDANGNVAVIIGRFFTGATVDPNLAASIIAANPSKQQSDIYIIADGSNPNNGRTFIYDGTTWLEVATDLSATDARYVNVAGDTMEGDLTVPTGMKITLADAPTTATGATNKAYVDAKIAAAVTNTANTLTATNGQLVSTVNGVASTPAVNVLTSADNGLTAANGNLKLGGSLNAATTITTDATKTLAIAGLQSGASTDKMVVVDGAGVLKSVTATTRNINTIVKKTADYTIVDTDYTILANATSNAFTLTLPDATTNTGRVLIIRKTDESANALTFSSAIKISEATSFTTLNINTTIRIQSDGTDWYKID
jgi:hypothetical protein